MRGDDGVFAHRPHALQPVIEGRLCYTGIDVTVRSFATALWLSMLTAVGSARAQSTRPGLNWVRLPGAEQCIGWRELGERVEARLGRTLFFGPSSAELSLDGHVAPRTGGGFVAQLAVIDAQGHNLGERTLETRDTTCEALGASLVLVIAVTLDPESPLLDAGIPLSPEVSARLDRLFRTEPDELALPEPAQPPAADAPDDVGAQPARARAPDATGTGAAEAGADAPLSSGASHFAVSLLGVAEAGLLPEIAPGLFARVLWEPVPAWAFALEGHWIAPQTTELAGDEPGRVTARLAGAELSACLSQALGPARARLCPGVRVDAVTVEPQGFVTSQTLRNDPWGSALLGAVLQLPWSSGLLFETGLHLVVPLVVRRYGVLDSSGTGRRVIAPESVSGRLEIGVGFRP